MELAGELLLRLPHSLVFLISVRVKFLDGI